MAGVLRFFRNVFLGLVLSCLLGALLTHSTYEGDKLAAKMTRASGYDVSDPEDPKEAESFCFLWAFRFGGGWALCQSILLMSKIRRRPKLRRWETINIELEAEYPPPPGKEPEWHTVR